MTDHDPAGYGAAIAPLYDSLYDATLDTEGAVARLAELAEGGPVLELGIGTGRLALPLAARGLVVAGIEGSADMAAALAAKPGGGAIAVTLGDFADTRVEGSFSLALLAVNTIFALPDQDAQVATFGNVARHLRSGGCFVLEAWVPDLGGFHGGRAVRPLQIDAERVLLEVAELDPVVQTMTTTRIYAGTDGVRLLPANHRYAWPSELDLMARLAGMRLEQRWSDWRGTPFTATSTSHVSVYRLI